MGYVDPFHDHDQLGADVAVGTADQLAAGKLQAAINRVILGARKDGTLLLHLRQLAEAAPFVPLGIDGQIGSKTNALMRIAGQIAGVLDVQLTTLAQVKKAQQELDQFAEGRGYAITDTVRIGGASGTIASLIPPGVPSTIGGISTPILAGGAILAGVLFAMSKRRPNPSRRRRRRRK